MCTPSPISFTTDESKQEQSVLSEPMDREQDNKDAEALQPLGPKPKRPLTAYNLFFQSERRKLLQSRGKCGFSSMGKTIAKKWTSNDIDPEERSRLSERARQEKLRYNREIAEYKSKKAALTRKSNKKSVATQKKKQTNKKKSLTHITDITISFPIRVEQQEQQVIAGFPKVNMPCTVSSNSLHSNAIPCTSSTNSLISSYIRQKKNICYGFSGMSPQNAIISTEAGSLESQQVLKDLEQGDPFAALPTDPLAPLMSKPSTRFFCHVIGSTMANVDLDSAWEEDIFQDDDLFM